MKRLITACSAIISLCIAGQLTGQDMEDTISVTSTIFEHHGMVPEENSAYGANTSIDVSWSNLPTGSKPTQESMEFDRRGWETTQ